MCGFVGQSNDNMEDMSERISMLGRIVQSKINENNHKWEKVFSIMNDIHVKIQEIQVHGNLSTHSMEAKKRNRSSSDETHSKISMLK
jgi:hypothetical protein